MPVCVALLKIGRLYQVGVYQTGISRYFLLSWYCHNKSLWICNRGGKRSVLVTMISIEVPTSVGHYLDALASLCQVFAYSFAHCLS